MQDVLLMQELNSIQHLLAHLQHCLQRQPLPVLNKQILQALAKQVHEHDVVLPLGRNRVDLCCFTITLGTPGAGPKEFRYLYILAS